MWFNVDDPITFDSGQCDLCGKTDTHWTIMQLLSDGLWRELAENKSMRMQGLDEIDARSRIYCIHACSVEIVKTLTSEQEMTTFLLTVKERRRRQKKSK